MPEVDANMAAALAVEEPGPRTIVLDGHTFTFRDPVPVGALSVFAMRLSGGSEQSAQIAAIPMLLRAWFIPEDHIRMLDYFETVADLEVWSRDTLPLVVEAATGRPT